MKKTIEVLNVEFLPRPTIVQRVKYEEDKDIILDSKREYSLYQDKLDYPSRFEYEFKVKIEFTYNKELRKLIFTVPAGYRWNNADICGVLKAFCSPDDRKIILASGLHDYVLEFKAKVFAQLKQTYPDMSVPDYRLLTSRLFQWVCKDQGFGPKATIMANLVDCFQKNFQKRKWVLNDTET